MDAENTVRRKKSVVNENSGTTKEILNLAYPLMISFLSLSIMGVVDMLVLGYVGTPQQGGAGLGMTLFWTVVCLFTGTISAISTFVSQGNGAGKHDQLSKWVLTSFMTIPVMTLLVWLIVPFIPEVVRLLKTTEDVQQHVVPYMTIRVFGATFIMVNFTLAGFLRGLADTKTPMVVTVIANLVNLVMDVVLVFGIGPFPEMGVRGAALASVIGTASASALYLFVYFSKEKNLQYQTRKIYLIGFSTLKEFLKVGAPLGIAWFIESLSWTVMTVYVASIDPEGLAAHTIVFQIIHVAFMPTVALSIAASTLIGQYLGAERVDLAKLSARKSIISGLVMMGIIGIIFAVGRTYIVGFFSNDAQVIQHAALLLIIAAAFQVFDALGITASGILRGAGDTRFPMFVQVGLAWFIFIPLIYFFGKYLEMGVLGAWIAALIFVVLLGIVMFARVKSERWTKMRVG